MSEVIDTTAIVVREKQNGNGHHQEQSLAPVGLFGAAGPAGILKAATDTADVLARVVETQKLFTNIQGRKHVRVEGWTLLGNLLGVFPVVEWSRPLEHEGKVFGWECRASARTMAGLEVGAAEAMCTKAERTWASRDSFALRSMAQTRAISKALRLPLGFIMTLAGYEACPEEEMPDDLPRERPTQAAPQRRAQAPKQNGKAESRPQPSEEERRKRGLAVVNILIGEVFGKDRDGFYAWALGEGLPVPNDDEKGRPSLSKCTAAQLSEVYRGLDFLKREREAEAERGAEQ